MRTRAALCGGLAGALALLVAAQPAMARTAPCPVGIAKLDRSLRALPGATGVLSTIRRDPDSGEPVRRTVVETAGGTTLVVEQKNCTMWNLSVTLLTRGASPSEAELRLMGRALATTPLWRKWFAGTDAPDFAARRMIAPAARARMAAGAGYAVPLDSELVATGASSEALLAWVAGEPRSAPWAGMLTLTISVGGQ